MKTVTVGTNSKYARPVRTRTGSSKYDEFLDAFAALEEGQGVVETFDTPEEAISFKKGSDIRRRTKIGLGDLDLTNSKTYVAADEISVVLFRPVVTAAA